MFLGELWFWSIIAAMIGSFIIGRVSKKRQCSEKDHRDIENAVEHMIKVQNKDTLEYAEKLIDRHVMADKLLQSHVFFNIIEYCEFVGVSPKTEYNPEE